MNSKIFIKPLPVSLCLIKSIHAQIGNKFYKLLFSYITKRD